jgi:hypothetical protein
MYCSRIHIQRVLFEKHGQDQKRFAVPRVLGAIRSMVGEPGKFLWKVCKIKATAPQVMTASGSGNFMYWRNLLEKWETLGMSSSRSLKNQSTYWVLSKSYLLALLDQSVLFVVVEGLCLSKWSRFTIPFPVRSLCPAFRWKAVWRSEMKQSSELTWLTALSWQCWDCIQY